MILLVTSMTICRYAIHSVSNERCARRRSEETTMTEDAPDRRADRNAEDHPGLPRWVRLLAIGGVVALVVLVAVALLVGGDHGPGMHG
jgi:hypothetical protein